LTEKNSKRRPDNVEHGRDLPRRQPAAKVERQPSTVSGDSPRGCQDTPLPWWLTAASTDKLRTLLRSTGNARTPLDGVPGRNTTNNDSDGRKLRGAHKK